MYLLIEENPNCLAEERVFSTFGEKRVVEKIPLEKEGRSPLLWDVTAVEPGGKFGPAHAIHVEDSSAGSAWLILGGEWGLRFRPTGKNQPWSLTDKEQWGAPFLVLDLSVPIELEALGSSFEGE